MENITISKVERLKPTVLEEEELNKTIQLKIKEVRKKIKNLPKEKPFDFTDYAEKQKEENEMALSFFSN